MWGGQMWLVKSVQHYIGHTTGSRSPKGSSPHPPSHLWPSGFCRPVGRQSCGKPLESIKVALKEPGATITSLDFFSFENSLLSCYSTGLELSLQIRLTQDSQRSTCLGLKRSEVKGVHLHIQLFNFCKFKSRALESFIGVQHMTFLWISSLQLGVSHLQDPIERGQAYCSNAVVSLRFRAGPLISLWFHWHVNLLFRVKK